MSSPFTVPILRATRSAIGNRYIVRLKESADMASHLRWLQQQRLKYGDESSKCEVAHTFESIKGYSTILIGPILEDLAKCDDVKSINGNGRLIPAS
ncbi:unnamed protein product [Rhizoctonia solani]|uniref:Inhibitor I9 domain-containing protein n=1 Tax=Rhizoctonia solani TaxID=456999 RepID=A0A8H3DXJ2_9AGAM|nr:unnamed protein product [Rhizoctonia solani]